jgi:hypothetical protein
MMAKGVERLLDLYSLNSFSQAVFRPCLDRARAQLAAISDLGSWPPSIAKFVSASRLFCHTGCGVLTLLPLGGGRRLLTWNGKTKRSAPEEQNKI